MLMHMNFVSAFVQVLRESLAYQEVQVAPELQE